MAPDRKPVEQEAVRTTIVGGRPPGSGKPLGPIPRGIEVLVKKAAVDAEFKRLLLEKRAGAAKEIGLALDPAEAVMLAAAPAAQLESVIAQTTVAPSLRPAFLGRAAAVMLVALGVGVAVATGEERAATQTAPPSAKQPAEPPVKSASAAVSEAEAAAIQAVIDKEYLPALSELATRHAVAAKAVRISVALDAAGSVQSLQVQNPAEAGPVGFREELASQIMKWKFPDVRRACTLVMLLQTPKEMPAAGDLPPEIPIVVKGLRAIRPPQPVVVQPARVTVFPNVVAVSKEDAAAMQARIVKDYQAAFVDLATKQGAAGKTARFSLSLNATGGVESVQFLNPGQAGTPEFRNELTGQILKWQFPLVKTPGAATVSVETTAQQVPLPARPIAGVPAMEEPTETVAKPGRVTVVPGIVPTPTADETAPAAPPEKPAPTSTRADQPKAITYFAPAQDPELLKVQWQEMKESEAEVQKKADEAKAAEKKMAGAKAASGAVSDEEAAAIQDRITKEYLPALTDLSARYGVAAKAIRISVALGAAGAVQSLQVQNPSEAGSVGFREELAGQIMKWKFPDVGRACTLTVLLETPKEVPAAEQPSEVPVVVHGLRAPRPPAVVQPARVTVFPDVVAVTKDDAAAMQARIEKEYQAPFIELAGRHNAGGKPVGFSLSLDAAGGVESIQFHNPAQSGTPEFRDQLTGQVMKWKFPDISRAAPPRYGSRRRRKRRPTSRRRR